MRRRQDPTRPATSSRRRSTPQAFVLPRLHPRLAAASPGFYREAGTRLGFYEAGGAPQIMDPLWNAVRLPEAVVRHEDMHQQLTINTHHGVLTQLLTQLAKAEQGREALTICLDEQWSVQEITATFAELMFVQHQSPKDFEDEVAHLPTAPPYRKLFDAASRLVPPDRVPGVTPLARSDVITAIAASSLQTNCLTTLEELGVEGPRIAAYLREESPDARFERLVAALGSTGIDELLGIAATDPPTDPATGAAQRMARLLATISRRAGSVVIEPPDTLASQAERVMARFLGAEGGRGVGSLPQGIPPEFVDAPEKQVRLRDYVRPSADSGDLAAWLPRCEASGGEMHLIVGTPAPDGCPFSAVCMTHPEPGLAPPDDLRGAMSPQTILGLLEPYARFPGVVTFIGDAWIPWYGLLRSLPSGSWVHERLLSAVRICSHRKLSVELVGGLLDFERLGVGARSFVFDLNNGLFVGCIDNPDRPRAYGLQKIASEQALRLFAKTLDAFGVKPLKNPATAVPDFELLRAIVNRESRDPAGFR